MDMIFDTRRPRNRSEALAYWKERQRQRAEKLESIKPGRLKRIRIDTYWTIVRTPRGRERFAKLNIEKGGDRCFIPRVHDGSFGHKLKPLFECYVFVELKIDQAWMHLQYTPGVIEVLRNMGKAVRCQDELINQLIREQGADGYLELSPARYDPQEGEQIKIVAGLFKDHVARYIGRDPDLLMQAALDFMGKEIVIPIKRSEIAKPDPLPAPIKTGRVGGATPKSESTNSNSQPDLDHQTCEACDVPPHEKREPE